MLNITSDMSAEKSLHENGRVVSIRKLVGAGYGDFWRFKGRYRVCKGSRASKKSKTAALNLIVRMMRYPGANLLVVRKVYRTLRDSCYTELKWAVNRLGVEKCWECKESPLEMTYITTGQKIYFRGLDDPLKVTSIASQAGTLCWLWIEEAYEIAREEDFDILDESIRGAAPPGLFKQITLTFNPWNERHWLKHRFFEAPPSPDILAKSTNYLCNEFLDSADRRLFQSMKINNPKRYRVAGLGEWGVSEGLIYENWDESEFDIKKIAGQVGIQSVFGLDFGYTNDPSAMFCGLVDMGGRKLYVFDELYERALTNIMLYDRIANMGYAKEQICADAAEPKSIEELWQMGLRKIVRSGKGKDSINNGIQFLKGFKIIIHPRCVNFLTEISSYIWAEDTLGTRLNRPAGGADHLMDAMRYAVESIQKENSFSFD